MSKTGKRSVYVRARWAELLDQAVEFEAKDSGEAPSISRAVEAAVRRYVEPRVRSRRWDSDVAEACEFLYDQWYEEDNKDDDMLVDACWHEANRSALVLWRYRDGENVSDDELAAAGWTPNADGHKFTGFKTARAIEAQQRLKAQEAGPFEG